MSKRIHVKTQQTRPASFHQPLPMYRQIKRRVKELNISRATLYTSAMNMELRFGNISEWIVFCENRNSSAHLNTPGRDPELDLQIMEDWMEYRKAKMEVVNESNQIKLEL